MLNNVKYYQKKSFGRNSRIPAFSTKEAETWHLSNICKACFSAFSATCSLICSPNKAVVYGFPTTRAAASGHSTSSVVHLSSSI